MLSAVGGERPYYMAHKIKTLLVLFSIFVGCLLLLLSGLSFYKVDSVNQIMDIDLQRTVKIKDSFADLKFNITEIQQFLTDSAATGEQDGVTDASKRLADARRDLSVIAQLEPHDADLTRDIDARVQRLFDTGRRMVNAYAQSREAGNAIMKGNDGFDQQSDGLKAQVDKLNLQVDASREGVLMKMDSILESFIHLLLPVTAIIFIAVLLGCWRLYREVIGTLGLEPIVVGQMAKDFAEGHLRVDHTLDYPKTSLAGHLMVMRNRWVDLATALRGQAFLMSGTARAMAAQSSELVTSFSSQGESTSAIAVNIEEFATTIDHMAEEAEGARDAVNQTGVQAKDNVKLVQQVTEEVHELSVAVGKSAQQIEALNSHTDRIASVVTVIHDIAKQTNLLALNAAIEAARAGEVGRGFAVVADEVRKLADRTSHATIDINAMIAQVNQSTMESVATINAAVSRVDSSVDLTRQAVLSMEAICDISVIASQNVNHIHDALVEQRQNAHSIASHIAQISAFTDSNIDSAEQVSSSSDLLNTIASTIEQEVSFFKIDDAHANENNTELF